MLRCKSALLLSGLCLLLTACDNTVQTITVEELEMRFASDPEEDMTPPPEPMPDEPAPQDPDPTPSFPAPDIEPPPPGQALDLGDLDRAAAFVPVYAALLNAQADALALALQEQLEPEGTSACAESGERSLLRDTEMAGTQLDEVSYSLCADRIEEIDGALTIECEIDSTDPGCARLLLLLGDQAPLRRQTLRPDDATVRTLLLGRGEGTVGLDAGGELQSAALSLSQSGRYDEIDGQPQTAWFLDAVTLSVSPAEPGFFIEFSGDFRLNGNCGQGEVNVASLAPIQYEVRGNDILDGEIRITSASGSADLLFDIDASVIVTHENGSRSYTPGELADLCRD